MASRAQRLTASQARSEPYPATSPADFGKIGYERRDADVQPRVLVTTLDIETCAVTFHVAGEDSLRTSNVRDVAQDADLIAGMEPAAALRIGYAQCMTVERNSQSLLTAPNRKGQSIHQET